MGRRVNRIGQRRFAEVRPHVYQDGDSVTMQFQIGEIQKRDACEQSEFSGALLYPNHDAFLLFHEASERIAMLLFRTHLRAVLTITPRYRAFLTVA